MTDIWLQLHEYLHHEILARISPKMHMKYAGNNLGFSAFWADVQIKVIEQTAWKPYWQQMDLENSTLDLALLRDYDVTVLLNCMGDGLGEFIDSNQENDLVCIKLRELYNTTCAELRKRDSTFNPAGKDRFEEYLAERGDREEIDNARVTGSRCIHCGSSDVHSKGKEWQCGSCGKRFRKH
jgi:hypothetical protein